MAEVAVYSQINTKIQCGQNVQLLNVKLLVHHVTSRLKRLIYTVSGTQQSSYLMDTGDLFPVGKATAHEADHLPTFVMRLRGNGAVPPLHQTLSLSEHTDFVCTFFFTGTELLK